MQWGFGWGQQSTRSTAATEKRTDPKSLSARPGYPWRAATWSEIRWVVDGKVPELLSLGCRCHGDGGRRPVPLSCHVKRLDCLNRKIVENFDN